MAPKITYCATAASIAKAVSVLSSQNVILVDCEAQELGRPDGVLSIISLSGANAKHVFLVDALAFPSTPAPRSASGSSPPTPRPHPALAPLLALLSLPRITKVFWDGRADALELLLNYGLVLNNVLDLQLVDVVARARNVPAGRPAPDLVKGYFRPMKEELKANPGAYTDIYALRGLAHVVGWFQLVPKGKDDSGLKDPAVVAMHESGGFALWLARPLPAALLTYAAHDLALIALVYAHFMEKAWVRTRMPALRAQSAAYVAALETRAENERMGELGLKRFMPMGIVGARGEVGQEVSGEGEGTVGQGKGKGVRARYGCGCCGRWLGADCFVKRVEGGEERKVGKANGQGKERRIERLSFCRLCNAVALRNERETGEWVEL